MRFFVKVIPKSSRQEVVFDGNVIKVWLHAPPADGKANEELMRILAEKFGVPKSAIKILKGSSSKMKTVEILGMNQPFSGTGSGPKRPQG